MKAPGLEQEMIRLPGVRLLEARKCESATASIVELFEELAIGWKVKKLFGRSRAYFTRAREILEVVGGSKARSSLRTFPRNFQQAG